MTSTVNRILQNFIPFQGIEGTPSEKFGPVKVDPMVARYAALQGEARGYDRELPVAMAGAESTFGKYRPGNPVHYLWKTAEDEQRAVEQSSHNKRLLETLSEFEDQGMPQSKVKDLSDYLYLNGVRTFTNIDKSLDKMDEKKQELEEKTVKGYTPERLAWFYQGNGTPNRTEVPNGIAYGKPVEPSRPGKGHSAVVMSILKALQSTDSELGNYIREVQ